MTSVPTASPSPSRPPRGARRRRRDRPRAHSRDRASPHGPDFTGATLAEQLALEVLLVAANRLGTINHTALAVAELRRRALPLRGIVLVDVTAQGGPARADTAREIAALTGVRPLGVLGYTPVPAPLALASRVAADLALRGLFAGRLAAALGHSRRGSVDGRAAALPL